jgi:hypothetical protein
MEAVYGNRSEIALAVLVANNFKASKVKTVFEGCLNSQ